MYCVHMLIHRGTHSAYTVHTRPYQEVDRNVILLWLLWCPLTAAAALLSLTILCCSHSPLPASCPSALSSSWDPFCSLEHTLAPGLLENQCMLKICFLIQWTFIPGYLRTELQSLFAYAIRFLGFCFLQSYITDPFILFLTSLFPDLICCLPWPHDSPAYGEDSACLDVCLCKILTELCFPWPLPVWLC